MKTLLTTLVLTLFLTGCAETWKGVKSDSSDMWEKTKSTSSDVYEGTKEAIHKATE